MCNIIQQCFVNNDIMKSLKLPSQTIQHIQYKGQKKKKKITRNDLQNTTPKTNE